MGRRDIQGVLWRTEEWRGPTNKLIWNRLILLTVSNLNDLIVEDEHRSRSKRTPRNCLAMINFRHRTASISR
jgi:hypothetical protein